MIRFSGRRSAPHLIATVLLLVTTLAVSKLLARRQLDSLQEPLDTIPRQIAGFIGTDNRPLMDSVLAQLRPTSYLSRTYQNGDVIADLFIAFYAQQRAGESMHSPRHCLPGAGWEIWDYSTMSLSAGGRTVRINKYSISRDSSRMLALYWYQSKRRVIASEYLGKLLLARDALLQRSTAASIVRIIVPDRPGVLERASALAAGVVPQVQRCFGQ